MHRKIAELADAGTNFAVALVLSTAGSTPQQPGARAIIEASGRLWGTVGGGPVEAEAQRLGLEACRTGRPCVLDFDLAADDTAGAGAICGGRMRLLIDPTAARHRDAYAQAADSMEQRRRGVLLTRIRSVPEMEVVVEWQSAESLGACAEAICGVGVSPAIAAGTAAPQEGSAEVFIEPIVPRPLVVIAGGGHVGQAVAIQAVQVGFDVLVIDDRPEFTSPVLFPPATRHICGPVAEQLAACALDEDTYVVLVTRGHRHDAAALAACIHRQPAYLGMIGSRRKVALIRQQFLASGMATEAEFERVFAPIGVEIGAVTVPEIAVSIVAQLIAVRRKVVVR